MSNPASEVDWMFVANTIDIQCESPPEVAPGCTLRYATLDEAETIRAFLSKDMMGEMLIGHFNRFGNFPLIDVSSGVPSDIQWTIARNSKLTDVELPCNVMHFRGGGIGYLHGFVTSDPFAHVKRSVLGGQQERPVFSDESAAQMMALNDTLPRLISDHKDLARAIGVFSQTTELPRNHTLYPIGLFACIEMLLTHKPQPDTISHDSISHQVATKFIFLRESCDLHLNYSMFEETTPHERIWKALYSYRSALAHGQAIDFERGSLIHAKSAEVAREFLYAATKSLIRFFIDKPGFVTRLRAI